MSETATTERSLDQPEIGAVVSKNALISVGRVLLNAGVYLLLPLCLIRWMPVAEYAAWVLILQLSAYVSFLDMGGQSGVAKFVAEFAAKGDYLAAGKRASTGLAIMLAAAALGILLSAVLAWQVPALFHAMPATFYTQARTSVLLMGISFSLGLVASVYSAVFIGLQRYAIPMTVSLLQRSAFAAAVILVASCHGTLVQMAFAGAAVNIAGAVAQYFLWARYAAHIPVRLALVNKLVAVPMLRYCLVLALWSGAMLCINGLDVVLVGHYDFHQAAYYSVAALPTSLMIATLTAMLSPLIPAASALSTHASSRRMADLLIAASRYSALLLLLVGVPSIAGGYAILTAWVGHDYAQHALPYMRILILANMIRYLLAPYATMVVAVGRQWAATASGISEAVVNIAASILLAHRFGAIGVAYGTLIGAFVGVLVHLIVSMRLTQGEIHISAGTFLARAFARAAAIALPCGAIALYSLWISDIRMSLVALAISLAATVSLAWFAGLLLHDRQRLCSLILRPKSTTATI